MMPFPSNVKNIHATQARTFVQAVLLFGITLSAFGGFLFLGFRGIKPILQEKFHLFQTEEELPYSQKSPNCGQNCKAMVVSAHSEASEVGVAILKKGGNAVDAAIATQFALAVVFPAAGNIGGGGFMVYRASDGKAHSLDYREKAPSKAFKDMYLDANKNVIEGLSVNGHLAAGVPGTVAGLFEAHAKFGKLPMTELIQPAIDLAEKGFKLTRKDAASFNGIIGDIAKYSTMPNAFTAKKEWKEGEVFQQPDLGKVLRLIQKNGKAGFYEGETARLIVEEMKRGKGLISAEDLKNYEAKWREPIKGTFRGYELISMGPPSSGGVILMQLLKMIEPYKLYQKGWHTPQLTHLMVEAERRAYADRATHLGDTDFYPVPLKGMLDPTYIKGRMKNYNPNKASLSKDIKAGAPPKKEKEETTHLSVMDENGNAVSVTTTINGGYGSSVVVGEAGFLLNNEMDDFSAKPGVPNLYGLLGAEANKVEGNKRMLSAMTPTIVTKDGKVKMVVGTPGGSTIITSVFQTILNVLIHEMDMQKAVSVPRFHSQWLPDKISCEKDAFDSSQVKALKKMGHKVETRAPIGRVDAILVRSNGTLQGGADPRGDDAAVGY
ncbi:MAG: gamma-glutamyltransferase [Bacteroidia bacterium]